MRTHTVGGEMLARVRHGLWIPLLMRDEPFFLKRDSQLSNIPSNLIQHLKNIWFICRTHSAVSILSSQTNFRSSPSPANQSADVWEARTPLSSSSLLSSCHSFSPFLITSEFLLSISGRKSLKMKVCHVSRRPAGCIPPSLLPSTNLLSLLMKFINPYSFADYWTVSFINRRDVSVFSA